MKKVYLNSDCQPFRQNQQSEQSPITSSHIIQWVDSLFLHYHVLRTPQKLITNDFLTMKTEQ
jgi:hypothetical protein